MLQSCKKREPIVPKSIPSFPEGKPAHYCDIKGALINASIRTSKTCTGYLPRMPDVHHLSRTIVTLGTLLILPTAVFAMEETVWDFRGGNIPGGDSWRYAGIEVPQTTPEGLRISAVQKEGSMLVDLALSQRVHVVEIRAAALATTEMQFLWHRRADPPGTMVQVPFTIPGGGAEQAVSLNVEDYPQWDPRTDAIGFLVPRGADVLLRVIRFQRWNVVERAEEALRSFWTFDRFNPFNINFIWGPVITFNPVGTAALFTTLPPQGHSGMWLLYVPLFAIAAGLVAHRLWRRGRRLPHGKYVMIFLLCYGALWIVFDVRMGAEILSYVRQDYETYLARPAGLRIFRTYLNLNDMLERTTPWLEDAPELAVLRESSPIISMVRYFSLPANVMEPEGPRPDLPVWLVYHRPDVIVDDARRLSINGVPWSAPGNIVERFDTTSFLFRTDPR